MKIAHRVDGCRPIITHDDGMMSNGESYRPEMFAERIARREYGRSGRVGAFRLDNWTTDGRCETYEAFIGMRCSGGGISGRNVFITIISEEV